MKSFDAIDSVRAAARATEGLAQQVLDTIGGNAEKAAAIQVAMEAMLVSVDCERNARVALSDAGFTPDTVDAVISTMRDGLFRDEPEVECATTSA